MSKVLIEVTSEDIRKGLPEHACSCPIAYAMQRAGLVNPAVYGDRATCDVKGEREVIYLPRSASNFVYRFDREEAGKPFSFNIEVPNV